MIKKLLVSSMVLALASVPFGPPMARAEDQSVIYDKVRDSLVYIDIEYTGYVRIPAEMMESGQADWSQATKVSYTCSGFVVDPSGFIATAGHCVQIDAGVKADIRERFVNDLVDVGDIAGSASESFLATANDEQWDVEGKEPESPIDRVVSVIQPDGPNQVIDNFTTVQVVDIQEFDEGDNALLKISGSQPLTPLVVAASAPKPGQALTAVGFPGSLSDVVDPSRLQQPSFKSGTASSQQVKPSGASVTEMNADVSGGMSGGPTVDNETGEVLGINSYGIVGETEAFNFITDAPSLRAFLQKNGVQLVALAPNEKPFPWMWVIIGVLAAAIVAMLVLLLVVLGRRKGGQYPAPVGPSAYPQAPGSYGWQNPTGPPTGGPPAQSG
jgi:hypothetical protein